MGIPEWEKHTLLADSALQKNDHLRSILHYQQALTLSDEIGHSRNIGIEDRLMISVISCHNMAAFWRTIGETKYELEYLQLATEKALTLVPQCPHSQCDSFIDSIGCCKKALVEFMRRHPNPAIAQMVQNIDNATNCNLIAKFHLN
ncbi:DUF2753 family protein [Vibrio sinensis]|uniref:DUF2753 family protein n=1 Tax=Vibrio sinensis TaxID=2302434 RepID=A0A3A6QER6_9VIBR|nr:DUF2753 family protein [Vibrio sinensis]RJX68484.1 DUF2753 family protein [Vibrio sinensis]